MGTIANKLRYLAQTKNAIKQAIIAKGVNVSDADTFRQYALRIAEIQGGGGGGSAIPKFTVRKSYGPSNSNTAESVDISSYTNPYLIIYYKYWYDNGAEIASPITGDGTFTLIFEQMEAGTGNGARLYKLAGTTYLNIANWSYQNAMCGYVVFDLEGGEFTFNVGDQDGPTNRHSNETIDLSDYTNPCALIIYKDWYYSPTSEVENPISDTDGARKLVIEQIRSGTTDGIRLFRLVEASYVTLRSWSYNSSKAGFVIFDMIGSGGGGGDVAHNYSYQEQVVGTWVDGRPLYEKTVDCGVMPDWGGTKNVNHGISNLDQCVNLIGGMYDSNHHSFPLPYVNKDSERYQIQFEVFDTYIFIGTGTDMSAYHGNVTLRYTKTTDPVPNNNS